MLVNLTYFWLIVEILSRNTIKDVHTSTQRRMRIRSLGTLAFFGVAALLGPIFPIVGMFLICGCLCFYIRPQAPAIPW
jgi:hypothetical protein